jgi:23S rRNA pseudouridine1911/1915/1917 synthase
LALLLFRVPELQAGTRLDRLLAERPELDSRALAEKLIATGAVLVDGERRAKSFRLEGGEEIRAEIPGATQLQAETLDIPIVWEDEHLLVVDKPAGLVVHPAGSTRTGTLVQGLLAHGAEGGDDDDRPGIVHRLDRDTSGLLVVARSAEAYGLLQELIASSSAPTRRSCAGPRSRRRDESRRRSAATGATARVTRSIRRHPASRSRGSR